VWKLVEVQDVPLQETPTTQARHQLLQQSASVSARFLLTALLLQRHQRALVLSPYTRREYGLFRAILAVSELVCETTRRTTGSLTLTNGSSLITVNACNAEQAFHGESPNIVVLIEPETLALRHLDEIMTQCYSHDVENIWQWNGR
jgi:hypothetical protein